jgi:hypothetical protein
MFSRVTVTIQKGIQLLKSNQPTSSLIHSLSLIQFIFQVVEPEPEPQVFATMMKGPFWFRRYFTIIALAVLVVTSSYWITSHILEPTRSRIAILTTDTRHPHVDLDPTVLLSSWTLTTL